MDEYEKQDLITWAGFILLCVVFLFAAYSARRDASCSCHLKVNIDQQESEGINDAGP
jgi:hypothetical protein